MNYVHYNPTKPLSPGRPFQGLLRDGSACDPESHAARWLVHVEAGRIGKRPAIPPHILANMLENERLLRGFGR